MELFLLVLRRLNVIGNFKELGTDRQRKETLIGLAATQLMVQLASMPIALVIPSVARHFDVNVAEAAWMVVIRLLMLGSTVFLAARLGQKYGHARVYFVGAIVLSGGSVMAATSFSTTQLILWSGLVGVGGAMVTANSNAILAMVFPADERGRAFAVPVVAARFGTLIGLGLFGLFLQFFSLQWGWRLVFLTSLPIGLLAIRCSYPLLKYHAQQNAEEMKQVSINYIGATMMVATLGHSYFPACTSTRERSHSPARRPQLPHPHALFVLRLPGTVLCHSAAERRPLRRLRLFQAQILLHGPVYQHLLPPVHAGGNNPDTHPGGKRAGPAAHLRGPGTAAQPGTGLFLPTLGGWIHDRYNPLWLRPASLILIASGFFLAGFFADDIPVLALPIMLLPIAIGSNLFNSPTMPR